MINYFSFILQFEVVDLVYEILQQYFSHHVLVNQRGDILRGGLLRALLFFGYPGL